MRRILRKIILWALDGALSPPKTPPPPPYDPAALDKIAAQAKA